MAGVPSIMQAVLDEEPKLKIGLPMLSETVRADAHARHIAPFPSSVNEESAVMRHRHADGAGPNRGVGHDETRHEVLIFASRYPVLQGGRGPLVTGAFRAVL